MVAKVDTWFIIGKYGKNNKEIEAELKNYKFQLSEDEALEMAKLIILIATLEKITALEDMLLFIKSL